MVSRMRVGLVLLALLAACRSDPPPHDATPPAVPGVETTTAAVARIRDVLRAPGVVTPNGLTPEARDAYNDLAAAEARLRLAEQASARVQALAPGNVAPRKDLEAALAEEASARAAAEHARQVIAGLGGAPAPSSDTHTLWVVARVPEESMPAVAAGAPATFTADVEGRPVAAGVVDGPPSYVDPTSRTAPVRIRIQGDMPGLVPGTTGSVTMEVGPLRDGVVVPEMAVVYDDRRALVFVDDGHGGFTATPVRLGVIRDGRVEVAEGLAAGTRVATVGAASLLSASRLAASGGGD